MRKLAATLVLAASCSSFTDRQAEVAEAFEAWRAAAEAGDAEKTFRGMSAGFKSEWLFQRLSNADPLAAEWRARMTGGARTDLDLWLEHQKRYRQGRADVLPGTVLAHPSLDRLWVECFNRDREVIRLQLSKVSVTHVFADETGATVTVRNLLDQGEMYSMSRDTEGWKIDGHREALRPLPK